MTANEIMLVSILADLHKDGKDISSYFSVGKGEGGGPLTRKSPCTSTTSFVESDCS